MRRTDQSEPEEPGSEVDPTGMREMLRTLPDPGPMPDHLVSRITARLESERQAQNLRARTPASSPEPASVVSLTHHRLTARPGRNLAVLGGAAAALIVMTVAVTQLFGDNAGQQAADNAAQVGQQRSAGGGYLDAGAIAGLEGADAESAAADAAPSPAEAGAQEGDESLAGEDAESAGHAAALTSESIVLSPLGAVTTDSYGAVIEEAAGRQGRTVDSANLTVSQINSCWEAVAPATGDPWLERLAATGELNGSPVVVLLGEGQDGVKDAFLLPWSCTQDPAAKVVHSSSWKR